MTPVWALWVSPINYFSYFLTLLLIQIFISFFFTSWHDITFIFVVRRVPWTAALCRWSATIMERLSYFQSVEQKYDRLIIDNHPKQDIFSGKHCTAEEDCGGECRKGACALPLSKEAKSLRRTESPILLSSHFIARFEEKRLDAYMC